MDRGYTQFCAQFPRSVQARERLLNRVLFPTPKHIEIHASDVSQEPSITLRPISRWTFLQVLEPAPIALKRGTDSVSSLTTHETSFVLTLPPLRSFIVLREFYVELQVFACGIAPPMPRFATRWPTVPRNSEVPAKDRFRPLHNPATLATAALPIPEWAVSV